ncbi:MAG: hypothetical protein HC866_07795 [Leptolyngbyaceae cyanobacterium RU_5_1]|nr:hypothetical protein [Leptolyngbyaceae cyanobacterium RU_5_1]
MSKDEKRDGTTRLEIANTVIEGSFNVTVALLGFLAASAGIVVAAINLLSGLLSPHPDNTSTPDPASTLHSKVHVQGERPASEQVSDLEIQSFINNCTQQGASYSYCSCGGKELQRRYSGTQWRQIAASPAALIQAETDVATFCLYK